MDEEDIDGVPISDDLDGDPMDSLDAGELLLIAELSNSQPISVAAGLLRTGGPLQPAPSWHPAGKPEQPAVVSQTPEGKNLGSGSRGKEVFAAAGAPLRSPPPVKEAEKPDAEKKDTP